MECTSLVIQVLVENVIHPDIFKYLDLNINGFNIISPSEFYLLTLFGVIYV
jgi:hypothetical protein